MSDPLEEAYYRYIHADPSEAPGDTIACPECESTDVDRKAGVPGRVQVQELWNLLEKKVGDELMIRLLPLVHAHQGRAEPRRSELRGG